MLPTITDYTGHCQTLLPVREINLKIHQKSQNLEELSCDVPFAQTNKFKTHSSCMLT